ncbi:DUF7519 family protein [Halobacterium litoreum]|uniref:Uncharacterized protein n=1 Tax=Halobacterium litoreum TaxID=2039234 RepID=A0ABD5NC62_9EURY|nr:hypothetical protein [Halobacterium litoreum]UHH14357.1 hypothetical protein LT972_04995 [Halobacterium litoreum]
MSAATVRRPTLVAGVAVIAVVAFAVEDATGIYGTLALLAAFGGGVLAVATGLASREEPLAVFAASVLAPAGGAAVFAAAGLSLADLPLLDGLLDPFAMLAFAAAGFGAVAAFTGGVGGGAVGRAFSVVAATTVLPFVAAVAAAVTSLNAETGALGDVGDAAGLVGRIAVTPTGGPIDVVVFFVVLAVTARALASGVSAAPLVELAPRHRRDAVARAESRVVVASLSVWRLFALSWTVALFALLSGFADRVVEQTPDAVVSLVGALASSGAVRVLMLATVGASLVTYAVLRVGRLVTGDREESLRRVAPTAGGGVLAATVGLVFAGRIVGRARAALPEQGQEVFDNVVRVFGEQALALAGLVVPIAALATLLLAFAALGRIRAVPQRGAPAAVAAAGLVLAGAVAGVQNANAGFVFGLVAAGMVVWDAGEYGVGLAAELGRDARTARVELVHVAASVGVGVLAYYGAKTLYGATRGLGAPSATAALAALVVAGLGLAALVAALAE